MTTIALRAALKPAAGVSGSQFKDRTYERTIDCIPPTSLKKYVKKLWGF